MGKTGMIVINLDKAEGEMEREFALECGLITRLNFRTSIRTKYGYFCIICCDIIIQASCFAFELDEPRFEFPSPFDKILKWL